MIDARLLRVGIELDKVIRFFEGLDIKCTGSKTNNSTQNEFNISISNLNRETRAYILTNNNILNRRLQNKKVTVEVGRESTGLTKIYEGSIRMVTISQPPDITLTLKTYTGDSFKNKLESSTNSANTNLSQICKKLAQSLKLNLIFQAKDKKIANYNFAGAALEQVSKIEELGDIDITIDDDNVIVKNENVALNGLIRNINARNGMIGIPDITERGIRVKILFDNKVQIGTLVVIQSELNPAANGEYVVYKINYDLANRQNQFYITLEGSLQGAKIDETK